MQTFPIRMLNGVGVVASKKRNIDLSTKYDKYFPKPTYSNPMLIANGENEMTIEKFIPQIVEKHYLDTAKIATLLKKPTLEATCRAIFDFVYKNIQYTPDAPFEEQIRTPARTWADRVDGVDCDCYTTFISSILVNLRITHYLRMAAYSHSRGYQHIYIIVPKNPNHLTGDYYTIDCVLDRFNDEKKPFVKVHDKLMRPVQALTAGLNGFPIRMLGSLPNLQSDYVFNEVFYNPALGTWALKGIDGGYYIQGDYNQRYVQPLDGTLGFISTALSVGKGLVKGVQAINKAGGIKGAISTIKDGGIKGAINMFTGKTAPKADKKTDAAPSITSLTPISSLAPALMPNIEGDVSEIKTALSKINENQVNSVNVLRNAGEKDKETLVNVVDEKTKALNKATVLSLKSIDTGVKSQLNLLTNEINKELDTMVKQGDSLQKASENTSKIAQAAVHNINQLNNLDKDRTREVIDAVEVSARTQQQAINQYASMQKLILVGIGLVAVLIIIKSSSK